MKNNRNMHKKREKYRKFCRNYRGMAYGKRPCLKTNRGKRTKPIEMTRGNAGASKKPRLSVQLPKAETQWMIEPPIDSENT